MTTHLHPVYEDTIRISIVQVSTEDLNGGAAIAAYRLYTGLKRHKTDVRMLVRFKRSTNPDVIAVSPLDRDKELEKELFSGLIHEECINRNRTAISNTYFSYPLFGYDFEHSELLKNADVINLHWINFFCSLSSLKKIAGLKKPVVWTLHDQWLLTGGCHYASGCDKFMADCMKCPQLQNDGDHLPHSFLLKKQALIEELDPVIVTPSKWLATIVKNTPCFKDTRVEIIPNSVDTSLYSNIPKKIARTLLNLPAGGFHILFSLSNAGEKRMGVSHLASIFRYCMDDPVFAKKVTTGEITILCFGDPGTWAGEIPVPMRSLGKITEEKHLSTVYSSADIFLSTSTEANFPNMVIESMSCGTPVVAFEAGGIPEMIQNGVNGYIIPLDSESGFAKVILDMSRDPVRYAEMSENSRNTALNRFSLDVQAKSYLSLYASLLNTKKITIHDSSVLVNQTAKETLPDASDIDNDSSIVESIREHSARYLVKKEIELQEVKAESYSRFEQIQALKATVKKLEGQMGPRNKLRRVMRILKNYLNQD
jgi:glycosyltransferase involved in cell wall biosynthesis